jgi:hypothetical protein
MVNTLDTKNNVLTTEWPKNEKLNDLERTPDGQNSEGGMCHVSATLCEREKEK